MNTVTPNAKNLLVDQVKDVLAVMSTGDLAKLNELFAEDIIYQLTGQHIFSGEYRGRDRILELLHGIYSSFRDGIKYTVSRCIAVDNTVVATFQGTGTTVNGGEYRNDYCSIWDFNDDQKVARITEYFDSDHVVNVLAQGS
ncbi:MAG TPA: nuclear transport factor 2 family protein [Mycobacterium sp.]|nr:nuclear transport factor 2 family protein [Mycobacterium sp.]